MTNNIFKVYSIQKNIDSADIVEVETVILNGLYKFSILGLNSKNTSEIKDRVYSALRNQKIINLKSNNKKITVHIVSNGNVFEDNHDLAIALSFLNQNDGNILYENILAVAGLSITGKTISTKNIIKTLYLAIKNNVKMVVCSKEDTDLLENSGYHFSKKIKDYGIKFIVGDTLGEIICNIKNSNFHEFRDEKTVENTYIFNHKNLKINDSVFKIILSISTNRLLMIQRNRDTVIGFVKNLFYYKTILSSDNLLELGYRLNKNDKDILTIYPKPNINNIDCHTTNDYIKEHLYENMYGVNMINNILEIDREILIHIKNSDVSGIIGLYDSCPCGKNYIFFKNNKINERCLCLQRQILKHKNKIQSTTKDLFDFDINEDSEDINVDNYKPEDYTEINNILLIYREFLYLYKNRVPINKNEIIKIITSKTDSIDMEHIEKLFRLVKDIQIYKNMIRNITPFEQFSIHPENVDMALDIIKKDF